MFLWLLQMIYVMEVFEGYFLEEGIEERLDNMFWKKKRHMCLYIKFVCVFDLLKYYILKFFMIKLV